MTRGYRDRAAAGRRLADELGALQLTDPVVLALPRGGVPVGQVLAERLGAPLDVLVVRKVGAPGHRELGLGAVGERDVEVLDDAAMGRLGVRRADLEDTIAREHAEVRRRVARYRAGADPVPVTGRDAVVVDDGVATGVTARAAVDVVRRWDPRRVVLAVPVGAPRSLDELERTVDVLVCPLRPDGFRAVGLWYADFAQVTDDEVVAILQAAGRRPEDGTPEA